MDRVTWATDWRAVRRVALRIPPSRGQLLGGEATFGEGRVFLRWREAAHRGFCLSDDSWRLFGVGSCSDGGFLDTAAASLKGL